MAALTRKKNKKEDETEASKPPAKIKKTKGRKKKKTVVADAGSKPSADNLDIVVETVEEESDKNADAK